MKAYSRHTIIINLGISVAFVLLGVLLFNVKSQREIAEGMPLNVLIGILCIIVNTALAIKWLYRLIQKK